MDARQGEDCSGREEPSGQEEVLFLIERETNSACSFYHLLMRETEHTLGLTFKRWEETLASYEKIKAWLWNGHLEYI